MGDTVSKATHDRTVIGLASIINNAIVMLWQHGQIEAASADIDFVSVRDEHHEKLAKATDRKIVMIRCDHAALQANFPPGMIIELPRVGFREILGEVVEARESVLTELARMQRQIDGQDDEFDDGEAVFSTRSELPSLGPEPGQQAGTREIDSGLPDK